MIDEKLYLRKATEDDIAILYKWVNDKDTRQNAFDTHIITYGEHAAWYKKMMEDPEQIQYILMREEKPVGQVRLTIENQEADIDYSIFNTERGRGYGKIIIRLIAEKVLEDFPMVKKLIGRVKPSNTASYRCFIENGFEEVYRQLELEIKK